MDKEDIKKRFGQKVKALRIARGMSQDELAQRLGYTNRSSINKIELGKNDLPRNKVAQLAAILGVEPIEFFKDDEAVPDVVPDVVQDDIIVEIEKLSGSNRARLEAYLRALLDSQEDE